MPSPLALHHVDLTWPDGAPVFAGLDLSVPEGRSGLVGTNGSGKSTLLRLLAGDLTPSAGHVSRPGRVGLLRQDLVRDAAEPVDAFLEVADVRAALHRIESGSLDPATYARDHDTVGDAWDIEERLVASLTRVGLPESVLSRRIGELSGGEVTQLGLSRLLLARPDVLLLDEPSNNLDRSARERLLEVLDTWRGTLLVVSHDPELLEHVDRIGELREGRLRWYGGGYGAFLEQVETEQAAAEQAVTTARADVRRQRHDLLDSERVLARRRRFAKKAYATTREPRAVMKLRKRSAEVSAAAYTRTHEQRLEGARGRLEDAESRVREDPRIRVDLPGTEVGSGRVVLRSEDLVIRTGTAVEIDLRGPERLALTGPNGSGKTTLLRTIEGALAPLAGSVEALVPVGVLPQRLDGLDDALSVADNVAAAGTAEHNAVRAGLARFGFRGARAEQLAGTLSGGERLRASLAALLLADPSPQLLLLDEPGNNLDLGARESLVSALTAYRGALVVVSHDVALLEEIGVDRELRLSR